MAVLSTTDLNLGTNVQQALGNVINRKHPVLSALPVAPATNAGGPLWNYDKDGVTVATFADNDAFDTPANDANKQATLGWGLYEADSAIGDAAISRARINGNPVEAGDQAARIKLSLVMAVLKKVENAIFQGSGSNSVIGFKTAIAASGSYAGLDHSSETSWTSVVMGGNGTTFGTDLSGTATALDKAKLRKFISTVKDNSSSDLVEMKMCAGSAVADVVKGLFDSNIVYSHNGVAPGASFVGQQGPTTVEIEGIPFLIADQHDGYFSDETASTSSLFVFPVNPVQPEKGVHLQVLPFSPSPLVVNDGLPYGIQILQPQTGTHGQQYVARCQLQLVVAKPLACGRLKDITIA